MLTQETITESFQAGGQNSPLTQGISVRIMNGGMTYDAQYFGENLFDELFDDDFPMIPMRSIRNPLYGKNAKT